MSMQNQTKGRKWTVDIFIHVLILFQPKRRIEILTSRPVPFSRQKATPDNVKGPLPVVCFGWKRCSHLDFKAFFNYRAKVQYVPTLHTSHTLPHTSLYSLRKKVFAYSGSHKALTVPQKKKSQKETMLDDGHVSKTDETNTPLSDTVSCPHGHSTATTATALSIRTPCVPVICVRHLDTTHLIWSIITHTTDLVWERNVSQSGSNMFQKRWNSEGAKSGDKAACWISPRPQSWVEASMDIMATHSPTLSVLYSSQCLGSLWSECSWCGKTQTTT